MNDTEIEQRLKYLEASLDEIKDILNLEINHNRDLTERRFRDTSEIIQGIGSQGSHIDRRVYEVEVFDWATTDSWNG